MCNIFRSKAPLQELAKNVGAVARELFTYSEVVTPRSMAPGLLLNGSGQREVHAMRFGLIPVGAKQEPKPAYNNARIENLEKWPWKLSLGHRCVVPLVAFKEPCYWGETAGTEAYFAPCDDSTLWVAAFYNEWRGTITMTFLMRPACDYVMEHGHHRQPIFITLDGIDEWMQPGKRSIDELKDILRRHTDDPELTHTVDRQMAASWKSRQSSRLKKRDEQLAELEKSMLPLGF